MSKGTGDWLGDAAEQREKVERARREGFDRGFRSAQNIIGRMASTAGLIDFARRVSEVRYVRKGK